jgi:hypothetical protein
MARIISYVILEPLEPEDRQFLAHVLARPSLTPRQYDKHQTLLAPRLILGLWHPLFIVPALTHLPLLRRYHIGFSTAIAKQYFWDACEGFSLAFAILMTQAGQDFVKECREAGKEICVWTVNHPDEMRMAMQWGVKAVLTDKVGAFVNLRQEVRHSRQQIRLGEKSCCKDVCHRRRRAKDPGHCQPQES